MGSHPRSVKELFNFSRHRTRKARSRSTRTPTFVGKRNATPSTRCSSAKRFTDNTNAVPEPGRRWFFSGCGRNAADRALSSAGDGSPLSGGLELGQTLDLRLRGSLQLLVDDQLGSGCIDLRVRDMRSALWCRVESASIGCRGMVRISRSERNMLMVNKLQQTTGNSAYSIAAYSQRRRSPPVSNAVPPGPGCGGSGGLTMPLVREGLLADRFAEIGDDDQGAEAGRSKRLSKSPN